jgi:hypothetical protein
MATPKSTKGEKGKAKSEKKFFITSEKPSTALVTSDDERKEKKTSPYDKISFIDHIRLPRYVPDWG